MSVRAITLIVAILVVAAAFAAEPQPSTSGTENPVAIFCQQTYALCIKAPCSPIVSRKDDGTYSIEQADCSCVVLPGWSMGPGPCDKRAPVTVGGRTYLMSTYSNFFNKTNATLSCPSSDQVWALCYGAPCVIDEKNPDKAVCTCPIRTGPAMTLGGDCWTGACKTIWSAATPQADAFANNNFFKYMTDHKLQPPPNPPAKDCSAATTSQ